MRDRRNGGHTVQIIKIKNRTGLTDFCALTRAALFLCGEKVQAEENGVRILVKKIGRIKIVTVKEEGKR